MTSAMELRKQLDTIEAKMTKVQLPVGALLSSDSSRAEFRTYLAYKKLQELKRRQVELTIRARKKHRRDYIKKRGVVTILFLLFITGSIITLDSVEYTTKNVQGEVGSLTGAVIGYSPAKEGDLNVADSGGRTLGILASPTQGIPILNSTFGTNLTTENLTLWNISSADVDGDRIKNIITWSINSSPFTLLELPFEG